MAEKKIGDRYFKAGEALATDAIRLQVRLVKLLGPAIDNLSIIFASLSPDATEAQKVASDAASIKAIGEIAARIDPDDMVALIGDVCHMGMISYTGKGDWVEIDVDLEFSGRNARDLFPVLIFILAETLGDFFSGFLANGRPRPKARA